MSTCTYKLMSNHAWRCMCENTCMHMLWKLNTLRNFTYLYIHVICTRNWPFSEIAHVHTLICTDMWPLSELHVFEQGHMCNMWPCLELTIPKQGSCPGVCLIHPVLLHWVRIDFLFPIRYQLQILVRDRTVSWLVVGLLSAGIMSGLNRIGLVCVLIVSSVSSCVCVSSAVSGRCCLCEFIGSFVCLFAFLRQGFSV